MSIKHWAKTSLTLLQVEETSSSFSKRPGIGNSASLKYHPLFYKEISYEFD